MESQGPDACGTETPAAPRRPRHRYARGTGTPAPGQCQPRLTLRGDGTEAEPSAGSVFTRPRDETTGKDLGTWRRRRPSAARGSAGCRGAGEEAREQLQGQTGKNLHVMKHGKIKGGGKAAAMYRGSSSLSWGTVQVRRVWFLLSHPGRCHPARAPASTRGLAPPPPVPPWGPLAAGPPRAPAAGPAAPEVTSCGCAVSAPAAAGERPSWILRRWKRREWTNLEEERLLRSWHPRGWHRGSVSPALGGNRRSGLPQSPPKPAPGAEPGPPTVPSPRGRHGPPAAPRGRNTEPPLTEGSADSSEARGRSAGRPEGQAAAAAPHRARDRRALPEGGRRSSWKATRCREPGPAREEELGLREPRHRPTGLRVPERCNRWPGWTCPTPDERQTGTRD